MAKRRVELVGAAGDEADVDGLPGQQAGLGQHLGRRIDRQHLADERREGAGERSRTTTEIEHAVLRAEALTSATRRINAGAYAALPFS